MKNNYLNWVKLDNMGTFYASTTNKHNPNIYRISVKLTVIVDKELLEEALNNTLQTISFFKVKLRKGFFWYYLEDNKEKPIIKEEDQLPFTSINTFDNNYYLFKTTYYEKRINVDFSHILTDGVGALYFIETLVTNYLKLKYPQTIKQDILVKPELFSKKEMSEDSFSKYSKINIRNKKISKINSKSYILEGLTVNRENIGVIIGTFSVKRLKEITKKHNVTITNYLTALLIYSIYEGNYKYSSTKDLISVCVPVNLRAFFPSTSMNNFFTTISVSINPKDKDYTFEDILELTTNKMKAELSEEVLIGKFRDYSNLQKNPLLRFVPLTIKDFLLKGANDIFGYGTTTSVITNLGIVNLDPKVSNYIDKFDVIGYIDESVPIKVGVISFEDKLSVSFSTVLIDKEVERIFFNTLANLGIEVKISSNIDN